MNLGVIKEKIKELQEKLNEGSVKLYYLKRHINAYHAYRHIPAIYHSIIGCDVTEPLKPLIEPLLDPDLGKITQIILGIEKEKENETVDDIKKRQVEVFIQYVNKRYVGGEVVDVYDWTTLRELLKNGYQAKIALVKEKIIQWLSE